MTLPAHLFASETDGALYDTRDPAWSRKPPLRSRYARHSREIAAPQDVLASLRAGEYAFPGGYQLYFITADGAVLSFDAVREQLRQVLEAVRDDARSSGWRVSAVASTGETDARIVCDHTGAVLAEGYEEDEPESDGQPDEAQEWADFDPDC